MELKELQEICRKISEAQPGEFSDVTFTASDYFLEIMAMPPTKEPEFSSYISNLLIEINKVGPTKWIIRCRDTGIIDQDDCPVFEAEDGLLFAYDERIGSFDKPDFHIHMGSYVTFR